MRRSSTPVAYFHTSKMIKICIYVYFSSIQISNWRFKSSRFALQNVNHELLFRIQDVLGPGYMNRKLDWLYEAWSLNVTTLNFWMVNHGIVMCQINEKCHLLLSSVSLHLSQFKVVAFRDQPSYNQSNFRFM